MPNDTKQTWLGRFMLWFGYRKETDGERIDRLSAAQKQEIYSLLKRQEAIQRQVKLQGKRTNL